MNLKNVTFILIFLLAALWAISCKKKDSEKDKQYSIWIVNKHDTFKVIADSSIDCNPDHSYCSAILTTSNEANWFTVAFALDYFPTSGTFELITPGIQPFAVKIYYNNIFYYHTPSKIDTMYATTTNNKTSYYMPTNWFVNYNNPTGDSIQVQGTFNIP